MNSYSFTLVTLHSDALHVTRLGISKADAELAYYLSCAGLVAKLYAGRSDGSLADIARQLARMRTTACVFRVDAITASAAVALAAELGKLRAGTDVRFWALADDPQFTRLGLGEADGLLIAGSAEDAARALLPGDKTRFAARSQSLYASGTLAPAQLGEVGLVAADGDFAADIEWLAQQSQWRGTVCVDLRNADCAAAAGRLRGVCQALPGARLSLRAAHQQLEEDFAQAYAGLPVDRVIVQWAEGVEQKFPAMDRAIAAASHSEPGDPLHRARLYMMNGYLANATGMYDDQSTVPATYHLTVPAHADTEQRRRIYDWYGSAMGLKSAAIVPLGDADGVDARLEKFRHSAVAESGGWPNHVYSLAGEQDASLYLDGTPESAEALTMLDFASFDALDPADIPRSVISIRTQADIAALRARLDAMHSEGLLEIPLTRHQYVFENTCRWLAFGACRLPMVRRVQVQADDRVLSCRDAGELGAVGDPPDRLVTAARQQMQLAAGERNCADCPVRDDCSRCASLPDSFAGQYCDIRVAYPAISLFFELHLIARILQPHLGVGDGIVRFRVSADYLPPRHSPPVEGYVPRRRPVIITHEGRHYAWLRGTVRLLRLSEPLAVMLEAHWLGLPRQKLVDALANRFELDSQSATEGLDAGMQKLVAGGLTRGGA